MSHYVCEHCGAVFDENEAATETFRHAEVQPSYTESWIACPACLSTEVEDAAYCYRCRTPVRYKDLFGGYYCKDCMHDLRDRYHEHQYVGENLDDCAEWIHEKRAKNHADEQDAKDVIREVIT